MSECNERTRRRGRRDAKRRDGMRATRGSSSAASQHGYTANDRGARGTRSVTLRERGQTGEDVTRPRVRWRGAPEKRVYSSGNTFAQAPLLAWLLARGRSYIHSARPFSCRIRALLPAGVMFSVAGHEAAFRGQGRSFATARRLPGVLDCGREKACPLEVVRKRAGEPRAKDFNRNILKECPAAFGRTEINQAHGRCRPIASARRPTRALQDGTIAGRTCTCVVTCRGGDPLARRDPIRRRG